MLREAFIIEQTRNIESELQSCSWKHKIIVDFLIDAIICDCIPDDIICDCISNYIICHFVYDCFILNILWLHISIQIQIQYKFNYFRSVWIFYTKPIDCIFDHTFLNVISQPIIADCMFVLSLVHASLSTSIGNKYLIIKQL